MADAEFLNSSSAGLEGAMHQQGCELVNTLTYCTPSNICLHSASSSSTPIHVFMVLIVASAVSR